MEENTHTQIYTYCSFNILRRKIFYRWKTYHTSFLWWVPANWCFFWLVIQRYILYSVSNRWPSTKKSITNFIKFFRWLNRKLGFIRYWIEKFFCVVERTLHSLHIKTRRSSKFPLRPISASYRASAPTSHHSLRKKSAEHLAQLKKLGNISQKGYILVNVS